MSHKSSEEYIETVKLVNEPEGVFIHWVSVSLITITVAMIFYGFAIEKNVFHPILTAILAIGLMLLAVFNIYSGIFLFYTKMKLLVESCEKDSFCKLKGLSRLKFIKNHLLFLGSSIGFFELLIALFVIMNTYRIVNK